MVLQDRTGCHFFSYKFCHLQAKSTREKNKKAGRTFQKNSKIDVSKEEW